ncbi:MAG: hypothetical protein PF542_05955 [Nanoarchaeota archaeon]|jgi:hypothetical protein|nr:hypothetical protein [Nanoarchaeota archaeon]
MELNENYLEIKDTITGGISKYTATREKVSGKMIIIENDNLGNHLFLKTMKDVLIRSSKMRLSPANRIELVSFAKNAFPSLEESYKGE